MDLLSGRIRVYIILYILYIYIVRMCVVLIIWAALGAPQMWAEHMLIEEENTF